MSFQLIRQLLLQMATIGERRLRVQLLRPLLTTTLASEETTLEVLQLLVVIAGSVMTASAMDQGRALGVVHLVALAMKTLSKMGQQEETPRT